MTTPTPIRKGTDPAPVTNGQVGRVVAWTLVYGALVPPIAVILWRLATGPWS